MTTTGPDVVVLGGTGYLGSALAALLGSHGIRTRVVGRRFRTSADQWTESVRADVTDKDALAKAVAGCGVVVHLVAHLTAGRAWRLSADDAEGARINVRPVVNLADLLVNRANAAPATLVTAGTTAVAGCAARLRLDGTEPDRPVTAYDEQKLAVERAVKAAAGTGRVHAVPLRLPTVYGIGAASRSAGSGVVTVMARRAAEGLPLTMWHDGSVRRD
ncbi:MAG: NAD-dependent epimerase/dehydratase family protein, partial [Acidimicrobiales bacterium]